ncbi:MAG: YciI family protein [Opitutae bacterium]|nr:YciI family protein [Opitutae bacterium]
MKYMLLVHLSKDTFDAADIPALAAAGRAYGEALQSAGVFVAGAGLHPPQNATTVSVRDGQRHVQDGPFADTKEFLGGFVIIDVPNLDAALEWAARHPSAATAWIEVRPLGGSSFR